MEESELKELNALLRELTDLKIQARMRSNRLDRSDADRKLSEGYAEGYAYAILRLKMIFMESHEG